MRTVYLYLRRHHLGLVAIFIALGGSAYAVSLDKGSVRSKHIKNGGVRSIDVRNNGLTGTDINEDTLGRVPSADTLDGLDLAQLQRRGTSTNCPAYRQATGIEADGDISCSPNWSKAPAVLGTDANDYTITVPEVSLVLVDPLGGPFGGIKGGVDGQVLTIIFSSMADLDSSYGAWNLVVSGGGGTMGANDTLTLVKSGNLWYEVARSNN